MRAFKRQSTAGRSSWLGMVVGAMLTSAGCGDMQQELPELEPHGQAQQGLSLLYNASHRKPSKQSSTYASGTAARANDGNSDGSYHNGSVSHTNYDANAWWEVDMEGLHTIDAVNLSKRTDCCGDRLSNFYILLSEKPFISTSLSTTLNQTGVYSQYVSSLAKNTDNFISIPKKRARYMRIQLNGTNYLNIAEAAAQALHSDSDPLHIRSVGSPATQSSNYSPVYVAGLAADGVTDGNYANGSVSITGYQAAPWWQTDLGWSFQLSRIEVYNRTDCCGSRLANFYVFVSNSPFTSNDPNVVRNTAGVSSYYFSGQAGPVTYFYPNRTGRYVRVQLTGTDYLQLAEVKVYSP